MKQAPQKTAPNAGGLLRTASQFSARLSALALITVVGMASGCASYNRDHIIVGSVPDDYRTRHPIIVSESERHLDIVVPAGARRMSLADRNKVQDLGRGFRRSGASSFAIIIPSGSRNETAARKFAGEVAEELALQNIGSSQILIQHYKASSHGEAATLRLAYTDLTAGVASECGKWNEDIFQTTENRNYENFGCATQNNLAQMIANPADLLGPRGASGIDSTRRTNTIEQWRVRGHGDATFKTIKD